MPLLSFPSRAGGELVLFALTVACSTAGNPVEPLRQRLEIVGATAIAPQQTTEVHAFLVRPNGTRVEVTPQVTWTSSDSAVLSVSNGRVTGGAVGESTLRANLDDLSGSTTVIVVPPGTFRLAGIVRDAASTSPVLWAQVQLTTEAGRVLTGTTDQGGFRFYGVAGRAQLKIVRSAFLPYEAEIDIPDHLTHNVRLSPININGSYTLTLSPSSRCRSELPEAMQTRTYGATIEQVNGSLTVRLHDNSQNHSLVWGYDGFFGTFGETDVIFDVKGIEEMFNGPVPTFTASGIARASISGGHLSGFLDGTMAVQVREGANGIREIACTASDHSVVFSR